MRGRNRAEIVLKQATTLICLAHYAESLCPIGQKLQTNACLAYYLKVSLPRHFLRARLRHKTAARCSEQFVIAYVPCVGAILVIALGGEGRANTRFAPTRKLRIQPSENRYRVLTILSLTVSYLPRVSLERFLFFALAGNHVKEPGSGGRPQPVQPARGVSLREQSWS